jgi:hypothetical protein
MNKREWMLHTASAAFANANTVDLDSLGRAYDAICAATPTVAQGGAWVEHDGDVSKAPEGYVEIECADGSTSRMDAFECSWDHVGEPGDVVRWRYA